MRKYVLVEDCPKLHSVHQHMIEDDGRVFCHGVGEWLTESEATSSK